MDTVRRMIMRSILVMMFTMLIFASWQDCEVFAAPKKQPKAPAKESKSPVVSEPVVSTPAAPEPEISLFRDATFMLPKGSRVSARWILPPTQNYRYNPMISVDASGSPVIGYDYISRVYLMNPVKEFLIAVEAKLSGITHLANGVLLLAAEKDLGLLAEPQQKAFDEKGVPIAGFQPIISLPLQKINLLSSAGNDVFCAGLNPQTGRHALYILRTVKGAGLKDVELLYESREAITAIAGNEDAAFVAEGRNVINVSRKDGSVRLLYTHPSDTVTGLSVTPAGIVAATNKELVLAGENAAIEIMRSSGHRIASRDGTVYVFFNTSMGVLAIENLADLKRFNLAVRPAAQGEVSTPLSITGVRFFESGPPPFAPRDFAESFERTSVRRIVAQIDYRGASDSKETRQHTITVLWHEPTGSRLLSVSYPAILKPRTSTGQMFASIGGETDIKYAPPHHLNSKGLLTYRFGNDALGLHYPGRYRVMVQVDGIPAGEWSFNLTGQAKPVEVLIYDDMTALQSMLNQGLNPGQKNDNGIPILNLAVQFGSAQAVELLLKKGANPNDTDKEGRPPLSECLNGPDWRAKAELLVRYGANVNAAAGSDGTPLVHSNSFRPDFTAFLIENGADIHSKNTYKKTLVEEIAQNNGTMCTEDIITLLLKRGADLNAAAKEWPWYSFLGQAISRANYECVALLLNKGASVTVVQREKDRPARSALSLALGTLLENTTNKYGKEYPESITAGRQIVRLLMSRGAKLTPGKKLLTSSIFYIEDFGRQLDERSAITSGETRIMFSGEALSFFDTEEISRTLDQDDAALEVATKSSDPAIRELALKNHLGRVRELTYASRKKSDLIYFVHDHCKEAFKLAEARYKPMQLDVVPDIQAPGQGTQNKSPLGALLLKRVEGGAYIQRILPGSAAARAGLRAGDIILALDTQKMKDADEIFSAVSRLTPGMPVRVTFLRDDPMLIPELPLTCGVLEKGIDEKGLAEMHLTRWLAANPDAEQARAVRSLLDR